MNERERIELLINTLKLSARQFAEQIHVQPGTISNMMSGRNNPSLDVMKRILQRYTTLNPEWLIVGNGNMWRTEPGKEAGLFDELPPSSTPTVSNEPTHTFLQSVQTVKREEPQTNAVPQKKIRNIVVYYTDGTYEEFSNYCKA